jgi:hypothetical protein
MSDGSHPELTRERETRMINVHNSSFGRFGPLHESTYACRPIEVQREVFELPQCNPAYRLTAGGEIINQPGDLMGLAIVFVQVGKVSVSAQSNEGYPGRPSPSAQA